MKGKIDFTKGNIVSQLIIFSIPIVLGELLQNLYNSVDALIVGNFIGTAAQAAVSVCLSPSQLLVGFFNGMSVGASVIVAQAFGKKDQQALDDAIRISFSFSVILGVLLSALGILCAPSLLKLSAVDSAIYYDAISYLRIYLAGLMFTVIYNIGAGILRAVGDTQGPFLMLLISCCLNIFFDLLFVLAFPLGVFGVGFATVCSQAISVLLVYKRLSKASSHFRLDLREIPQFRELIVSVLRIGVPAGLQSSLVSLSNLFVWRYINAFPPNVIAGVGIAQRLDQFVSLPCKAYGITMATVVGQNVGARNYPRSKDSIKKCLMLSLATLSLLGCAAYCFAGQLVSLFNVDQQVVAVGRTMMRVIIPFYFTMAVREIILGALRGYGNSRTPMLLSLIGMVVIRQLFLFFAMHTAYRIEYIYYCYPIAWGSTAILLVIYYFITRERYIQICQQPPN